MDWHTYKSKLYLNTTFCTIPVTAHLVDWAASITTMKSLAACRQQEPTTPYIYSLPLSADMNVIQYTVSPLVSHHAMIHADSECRSTIHTSDLHRSSKTIETPVRSKPSLNMYFPLRQVALGAVISIFIQSLWNFKQIPIDDPPPITCESPHELL